MAASIALQLPISGVLTTLGISWALYDQVLQIEDEVELVWTYKLSFGSAIYLASRSLGLAALILDLALVTALQDGDFNMGCSRIWRAQTLITAFLLLSVEVALISTVHALYKRNIWITTVNCMACAIQLLVSVLGVFLGHAQVDKEHFACESADTVFLTSRILIVCVAGWICLQMSFKGIMRLRTDKSPNAVEQHLVDCALLRQCVIFLVINAGVMVIYIAWQAMLPVVHAMVLVCGTRLMLGLRDIFLRAEEIPADASTSMSIQIVDMPQHVQLGAEARSSLQLSRKSSQINWGHAH